MRDLTPTSPSEIAESQPHVLCLYDVCDVFKGGIAPVGWRGPLRMSSANSEIGRRVCVEVVESESKVES